jgi:hypothetical protein
VRGSRTVAISFSADGTNLPEEGRTFSSALRRESAAAISRGRSRYLRRCAPSVGEAAHRYTCWRIRSL